MFRRQFLQTTLAGASALALNARLSASQTHSAADAVEQAHGEIWRRFIDRHGVMLDFTGLDGAVHLPTPEECRLGQPNALGWFQPIENGAMFNGLYIEAAIGRWKHSQLPADAARARKLMKGLLLLNSISDVTGFVGRGVSTDGKSHYPMGSNDQTLPWYLGLRHYLDSGLATPPERERITKHLVETTEAIVKLGWRMPAEAPFGTRGSFMGFHFDDVVRHLFVLKLMHTLTGEARWNTDYLKALEERGKTDEKATDEFSKRDICGQGMKFWYAKTHNWTSGCSVAALRALWEMEDDAALKEVYAGGLTASAALAAESLPLAQKFDDKDVEEFDLDWRKPMLPLWYEQKTETEAAELAGRQWRELVKLSPRRSREVALVREPTSAAWIVTLCPNREIVERHRADIERVLTRYDYSKLHCATFFWVEMAWWRLRGLA